MNFNYLEMVLSIPLVMGVSLSPWLVAPAKAQTTCSASGGDNAFANFLPCVQGFWGVAFGSVSIPVADYDSIATAVLIHQTRFLLVLPDNLPCPGGTNIARAVFSRTGWTNRVAINSVVCVSGPVTGLNSTLVEISLVDNIICLLALAAPAGAGGAMISYQATPSRTGDLYSTSAGAIIGGISGGTNATTDLDAGETNSRTFTSKRDRNFVIRDTRRVISNFMGDRAHTIVSDEADVVDRFLTGGTNGRGNLPGFAARGTLDDIDMPFATSLRTIRRSMNEPKGVWRPIEDEKALGKNGASANNPGGPQFDIWAQGSCARVDNVGYESDVGLFPGGGDYRLNESLLLGFMGQVDPADQIEVSTDRSIDGICWLVGPCPAVRLHRNIIITGRAALGQSCNNFSPLGAHEDDFNIGRWLLRTQVTGDFSMYGLTFKPSAAISCFREKQKAYADSLNNNIPDQSTSLGRAEAGPRFAYALQTEAGWSFAPHIGVKGTWDFDPARVVDAKAFMTGSEQEILKAMGALLQST